MRGQITVCTSKAPLTSILEELKRSRTKPYPHHKIIEEGR